jgi:hypothetical protein
MATSVPCCDCCAALCCWRSAACSLLPVSGAHCAAAALPVLRSLQPKGLAALLRPSSVTLRFVVILAPCFSIGQDSGSVWPRLKLQAMFVFVCCNLLGANQCCITLRLYCGACAPVVRGCLRLRLECIPFLVDGKLARCTLSR